MKLNRHNRLLAALGLAVTLAAPSAFADTKYWNGLTGAWNTASQWGTVDGGPFASTWTSGDDAVFNVASSAIAVNTADGIVSFNSITANQDVTISSFNSTLASSGASANVTVAAGKVLNITNNALSGGIVKLGDGEMTVGQNSPGLTAFTLQAGTVTVGNDFALGNNAAVAVLNLNGGTLRTSGNRDISNKLLALNIGGDFTVGTATTHTSRFTFNAPTNLGATNRTITLNAPLIFNGIVSSSGGGIIKEGTGSLTLGTGNHSYTGPTTINNAGTFTLNGSLTGGGAISTSGAAILTQGASSVISGASSIAQGSTGISTLAGNNTYTGPTTATAGVLLATKAAALSGYDAPGADKVTFNGGTIAARIGAGGWTTTEVDTLLTQSAKTSGALGIDTTTASLAQWTPFIADDNFGSLGLTKLGTNTLTLSETNTYTGATTVIAGTLNVTGGITGGGAVSVTGGTFSLAGSLTGGSAVSTSGTGIFNQSLGGVLNGATSFTQGSSGTSVLSLANSHTGGTTATAGTITLNGNLTGGGAVSTSGTGILTQGALSVISGASSLTQGSSGTTTLAGINTYTGTTTVTAGTLVPTLATALSGYTVGGKVIFNGGTIITKLGDGTTTGWSTAQVDTLLSNATKTSGALGIDTANGNFTQAVAFTTTNFGPLGLNKLGINTLTLDQVNTYTGTTTIAAGTLSLTGSLTGGGAISTSGSGILSQTSTGAISGASSFTQGSTGTSVLGGTNSYTGATSITAGTLSLTGSLTGGSAISTSNAANLSQTTTGSISGASSFTKGSSGTSTLAGANSYTGNTTITGGTLSLTGSLTGGSAISTSGAAILSQTAAGVISGASSFTQGSTGTSVLAGANSYSGTTSISAGTLSLTGSLSGSAVSTSGTGIITQSAAGVIGSTSSLVQGSSGVSTLAGINTYSGTTTATAGTLLTTRAAALSGYTVANQVIFNGGTIGVQVGGAGWTVAEVNTLLSNATKTSGALGIDTTNGNLTQGSAITTNLGALGLTKLGANTLTLDQPSNYTGPTTIANGGITINSLGSVNGGNSSLGAPTNATSGTISMGSAANTGQLTYLGTAQTTDRVINLAGTTGGAILDQSGTGALKFTSALTATGSGAKTLTLQGSTAGTGEIAGAIVDNGAVSINKLGTGTWTLSGNNTNTGGTSLNNGGTLVLDYGTNDNNKIAGGLSLNGGTLNFKGATGSHIEEVVSTALGAGGTFITRSGNNTVQLKMNFTDRAAGATISFSEANLATTDRAGFFISGPGNTAIIGGWATVGSDWAVSSTTANIDAPITAYTGYTPMVASVGSLSTHYQLTGALPLTGTTTAVGSLRIFNNANSQTLNLGNTNLAITSTGVASVGGILYAGGNDNNYTIGNGGGTGRIVSSSANQELVFHAHTGTLTVDAFVGLSAATSRVTKSGAGTLVFGAANNYTGETRVHEGTLRLTNNTGAGTIAGGIVVQNNAALELDNSIVVGAEALNISGTGIANAGALRSVATTTASYAGAIAIGSGGARINSDAGLLTLSGTITTAALSNVTFGGAGNTLVSTGVISGAGGLVKDGAGKLTLSATNTYTGATTVAAGVLAVNGSLANTSTTVQNTGTLQGSGAIGGGVTIQTGGTLAPGNSIESLATGALTMATASTFAYEVLNNTSTGADLLAVGSTISLTGVTLSLDPGSLAALAGGGWTLGNKLTVMSYFDAGVGITSGFTGYADDTAYVFGSNEWVFDYNDSLAGGNFGADAIASGQNKFITMTVIPEPSSVLLGGLGLLALLRRRR